MTALPRLSAAMSPNVKLRQLQDYIESFEYNHTSFNFFKIDKMAPFSELLRSADLIVSEALPIKCLEACALAIRLTMSEREWTRFPLRFGSRIGGKRFWHIVCVVEIGGGRYGVLGLSRCATLSYRPAQFVSLHDLISSFISAYAACGHDVDRIMIGEPFPHQGDMRETLTWAKLSLSISKLAPADLEKVLSSFSRRQLKLKKHWSRN